MLLEEDSGWDTGGTVEEVWLEDDSAEEEEDEEKFLGIEDDSYIYDAVTCKEMLDEIRMLPPQYSEVLIMRVVYNRTVPEISQLLNIDAALVRQRTHRAREILKKLYKAKKQ